MTKGIILESGKPPQFIGDWTIGEAMQMLQTALQWLGGLPLVSKQEDKHEQDTDSERIAPLPGR